MTFTFFAVLIIIVCFLLVVIIMVQNPKGGGLATTWTLAGAIVVLSILSSMTLQNSKQTGIQDEILDSAPQVELPAAPAQPQAPAAELPVENTPAQ